MKFLTTYKNTQEYSFLTDYTKKGVIGIKEEVLRPEIQLILNNKEINVKKRYVKDLVSNPYATSMIHFSKDELYFLSKTYGFDIEPYENYDDVLDSNLKKVNIKYTRPGQIFLMYDENENEYLMIVFRRWQHEYQPRGAGEDFHGEDIYYVLGIWKDPLLTDQIVQKIKSNTL